MKTAIAALVLLVAALGYFRLTDPKDIQEEIRRNPHMCPNATQHLPSGGWTVRVDSPYNMERQTLVAMNKKLSDESPLVTTHRWSSSPYHTE